jgi:hypothetical protein
MQHCRWDKGKRFSVLQTIWTGSGVHQTNYLMVLETLSLETKWLDYEEDHQIAGCCEQTTGGRWQCIGLQIEC